MSDDGWWTCDSYERALIFNESDPETRQILADAYGIDLQESLDKSLSLN